MIGLSAYINKESSEIIDENLIPAIKRVGIILLSSIIPYLISLGIRISIIKFDSWVDQLIKKYPKHKNAILIISYILKDDLDKCIKCKQFIDNSEQQKSSSYYGLDVYKTEILNCVQSQEDKKKIEELFKLIKSDSFKEEIDECLLNNFDILNEASISKYYENKAILTLLFYTIFDEYGGDMTFKEFKEKYNNTINLNTTSNYNINDDLMRFYKNISGKMPDKTKNPVPINNYVDTKSQTSNASYKDIAKQKGILY